jgi:integrase
MALYKKKGRNVWIYQVKINNKTWCRSTGETDRKKAEAKIAELKKLAQLHRSAPNGSLKLANAIVREVARIESDVSIRQAERVGHALQNFYNWVGDIALERIDSQMVESYQRKRLREAARATVEKELFCLLKILKQNGFHVERPCAKRGQRAEQRAFSHAELASFFQHCPERFKALFLLMLVTGARPAELIPSKRSSHVALLKNEIDSDKNIVAIRSAKEQLNQVAKVRTIQVPEELMAILVPTADATDGEHVFPEIPNLFRHFDRILQAAAINKVDPLERKLTAHSFRHTFATMMSEAVGHNPFVLKQILGHSQISTTDRYCHPVLSAPIIDISCFLRGGRKGWTQQKCG